MNLIVFKNCFEVDGKVQLDGAVATSIFKTDFETPLYRFLRLSLLGIALQLFNPHKWNDGHASHLSHCSP